MRVETRKSLTTGQPDKFTPTVNLLSSSWRESFNKAFDKLSAEFTYKDQPGAAEARAAVKDIAQDVTAARPTNEDTQRNLAHAKGPSSRLEDFKGRNTTDEMARDLYAPLQLADSAPPVGAGSPSETNFKPSIQAGSVVGNVANPAAWWLAARAARSPTRMGRWGFGALSNMANFVVPMATSIGTLMNTPKVFDRTVGANGEKLPSVTSENKLVELIAKARLENRAPGSASRYNGQAEENLRSELAQNPDTIAADRQGQEMSRGAANAWINSELGGSFAMKGVPFSGAGWGSAIMGLGSFANRMTGDRAQEYVNEDGKLVPGESPWAAAKRNWAAAEGDRTNLIVDNLVAPATTPISAWAAARAMPSMNRAGRGGIGMLGANATGGLDELRRASNNPEIIDRVRQEEGLDTVNDSAWSRVPRTVGLTLAGDPVSAASSMLSNTSATNGSNITPGNVAEAAGDLLSLQAPKFRDTPDMKETAERQAHDRRVYTVDADNGVRYKVDLDKIDDTVRRAAGVRNGFPASIMVDLLAPAMKTLGNIHYMNSAKLQKEYQKPEVVAAKTMEIATNITNRLNVQLTPKAMTEISNLIRIAGPFAAEQALSFKSDPKQDPQARLRSGAIMWHKSGWVAPAPTTPKLR